MQKINHIRLFIIQYYKKYKRDLPWRSKNNSFQDPYKTIVSEIMLQQTRVDKVIAYYKRFITKWPNINKLANAKLSEVLTEWSGLGYYRRAINLHSLAKMVSEEFNGVVPNDKETLKRLPGIGEYTSSALISFAFGKYSIIIDTNIKRFIIRIFGLNENIKEKDLNYFANILFPKEHTSSFAQGIMDYASCICLKIKPKCNICNLKKHCKYNFSDYKKIKKKKKEKPRKFCYSYFFITDRDEFLLKKRPLSGLLAGLYEVPTSDWKIDNWPPNSLGNVDLPFKSLEKPPTKILKHEFSHFILYTKVNIVRVKEKKFKQNNYLWIKREKINEVPISSLTNKIIDHSLSKISSLK